MSSQLCMTLYHVTNRISATNMMKSAMGLDLTDYEQLYLKVKNYLNVPSDLLSSEIPLSAPEYNGAVWFYRTLDQAVLNKSLAPSGGHYRNLFLRTLLERCASFMEVPYTQLQVLEDRLLGGLSEPVVLEVNVPVDQLAEPSKIEGCSEIVTKNKVSREAICRIISRV